MIKRFLLAPLLIICIQHLTIAQKNNITIQPAVHASHIAYIKNDSVVVVAGSTYRFTVDTPEDKGLVSTTPTATELIAQLVSKNGEKYLYNVIDQKGGDKTNTVLEPGDKLIVSKGNTNRTFFIGTKSSAISGRLSLEQSSITVNTKRSLTLFFTAGQRSPDVTVRLTIPAGINITMENTSVNVIGRGDVLLKDLAKQSIGRTGNKYSYTKVGTASITKTKNGGSLLALEHLDLRPANGADLKIVITDITIAKTGSYIFIADYTTSKPEILSSAGNETASLNVINTISDLERVIDLSMQYKETDYNKAIFRWTALSAPHTARIMQSDNGGKTWKASLVAPYDKTGSVVVDKLVLNKKYLFRLAVKQGNNNSYSNTAEYYSGK
ncbi:MAG TPA: endopygalactorunase, partial [Chitinophagaceae bacterium]|nr:endopygalactorunase [Chitinophagaceae bacterium]